jgi:hypothetical protein
MQFQVKVYQPANRAGSFPWTYDVLDETGRLVTSDCAMTRWGGAWAAKQAIRQMTRRNRRAKKPLQFVCTVEAPKTRGPK